ncbi:hypothetical protein WME90_39265 [Sorangium sp. So ce375]|uniref:hypothetical protein n=1 Tax=Sorangium sp. So ce375 TaxID=3133306 RepID=UPI003F5BAAAC
MKIHKIGLVIGLAAAALGLGVLGRSAGLTAKLARLGAPDAPQTAAATAAEAVTGARADGSAPRSAAPSLRLEGLLASLEGAVARELDAFCERANVGAETKQAVARVLGEHRRHSLSFVGHPRGDFLMDRLNRFTRARVIALLDPDQEKAFDQSELPGALGE